ncbi:DUF5666 domain-containing protein [Nitrosomonas sp.]|uniref:DUF5666 domain-containing protein n=1 Tax=Nitrosomonas sp. TaxID=42353 RepID=UPI001DF6F58B|nr:DUF5666 domain-containing protein [Nitrosomonas sp.]MBX3615674.1 hypothetical protein [Nitrosomonas sp.]
MKNLNLTARSRFIARIVLVAAIALCFSSGVFAKNNCDTRATILNPAMIAHADSGIGGTGITTTESGIGGTGLHEGGIGGTGNPAGGIGGTGNVANDGGIGGTGIIGIITGFASICVNGIEVHYDSNTTIQVDDQSAAVRDLAAGQLIAVRASGSGSELTARHIAIIHAAVGPISAIDYEKGEMRVLNQTVQLTRLEDRHSLSTLKTGDWTQVSGHRLASGAIVASRIETIPPRSEAKLNGYVTHIDSQGFEINGTRIHASAQAPIANISQGMEISVTGHWNGASLQAERIAREPTRQNIGNVQQLVIEGYIHALDDKAINLGNRVITLDSNTQIAGASRNELRPDQRIQITGQMESDQRIIPEQIEMKQEQPLLLQQKIDQDAIDSHRQEHKRTTKDEPEPRSGDGDQDGKHGNGKDGDLNHPGKDELKKETDRHSNKDHEPGDKSRASDSGKPSGDAKQFDRKESLEREQSPDSHRSDKSEKTSDSHSHEPINIQNDLPLGSDRDHSGHSDRDPGHRDTDHLRDQLPDRGDTRDSGQDRSEFHDSKDLLRDSDRLSDRNDRHYDGLSDRDFSHRDTDHIRDHLPDGDVRESVRDRSDFHDREVGHRDRDIDR